MTASPAASSDVPARDADLDTDRSEKTRPPDHWSAGIVYWAGVAISLAHLWFNTFATLAELTIAAVHFAGFGLLCALIYPAFRPGGTARHRGVLALDILLAVLLVAGVTYVLVGERALAARGFQYTGLDYVVSLGLILIALDFTRRTTGWIIPAIIVVALTYVVWWGQYLSGPLHFPGLTLELLLQRSVYNEDGMFGTIARISSTYVVMFILFGAFLIKSGAGDFIINLARALAGRMVGGPGLVAVIGSGLTGTISGSAVANTVSTGVITIPLMRKSGFPARFAAGVEAASSTGGQLMPPIMGAGAFVMANMTEIPYFHIVGVALLPALLYFLGVGFYVRIEARKRGLTVDPGSAPPLKTVLREGGLPFLLPLAVLIGLLVYGFTPTYAAAFAMATVVVSSWLTPRPMGPRAILDALALGARNMVMTAVLLVAVGLIVGVIATTGIGNTFSLMINDWAGGSLLIAIVLVALASLILGMGLPVTAAYIVLATLSAPALFELIARAELIQAFAAGAVPESARAVFMLVAPERLAELGEPMSRSAAAELLALVPPAMSEQVLRQTLDPAVLTTALLSAHMIIFWLSQDSNVTPPVCLTAFAAAAIARTRPMATGFTAWKIAKALYLVPLLFAYTPFLSPEPIVAFEIFALGVLGLYAAIGAIEGHLEAPVSWPLRAVLAGLAVALFAPIGPAAHLAAAAALIALVVLTRRRPTGRAAVT
ncbi:MAG: TRAP transporter fused permease subunit [Alphaproteobacteria bacterium]|jgi:TRAP transporter 4TM/12TM fusion protein|nr:TRAP transporter fused permease subunit [Alphaproteobacteria bacterium]